MDERPPPDLDKVVAAWMEFEKGTAMPGRVLADLKKAGLREILDAAVAARDEAAPEPQG